MITHELRELGLSEKEAKIYVALLELGPSVVSDISKKAGVNRSTVYIILGSLQRRGLVTEEGVGAIRRYNPAQPEQLIKHFEETAAQYKNLASSAHKLLPELKSVEKHRKERKEEFIKPKVQFFEGREGMQTVYEDTLASLENIRAYASVGNTGQASALARQHKSKEKIKVQVIFPNTQLARERIAQSKTETQKAFSMPRGGKNFSSEINGYDDRVIFISPAEEYGLVIEIKELAQALKKALASPQKETGGQDFGAKKIAKGLA